MNIGKARALFEQVASGEYHGSTVGEYLEAVKIILDMETHNSISKKMIISVCKWLVEIAEKAVSPYQWIPWSERLPEDLSEVNVTWVNRNPEPYYESIKDKPFTATAVYYKNEWYWYSATCVDYLEEYGRCDWNKIGEAIEITAWMPLPEAYKPNK